MQMVKKSIFSIFLLGVLFLALMPKEEIYFRLERELALRGVEINEEAIDENIAGLVLQKPQIYLKGIHVAGADRLTCFTLFFYTQVEVENLYVDESLKGMLPEGAETIVLTHSLLDLMHIAVLAKGNFGVAKGIIDLKKRRVHIDFAEEKEIGTIKSSLQKGEKGWYYETAF